jgi:hypothetical protein
MRALKTVASTAIRLVDSYVYVADSPLLNPMAFTFECLIKPTAAFFTTGIHQAIAAKRIVGSGNYGWFIYVDKDSKKINFDTKGTSGSNRWLTNIALKPETWTHLAFTFDGSTGVRKAYVNGVLQGESTGTGGSPATSSELYLGYDNSLNGNIYYLNAFMEEVRFWDYARGQGDISAYSFSRIYNDTGLMLSMRGSGLTPTQLNDDSGNNNHGTLLGNPVQVGDSPFNRVLTNSFLNGSIYYNGNNYHTLNSNFLIGVEEFAIEALVFLKEGEGGIITSLAGASTSTGFLISVTDYNSLRVWYAGTLLESFYGNILYGQWNHVFISRSGGILTTCLNFKNAVTKATGVISNTTNKVVVGLYSTSQSYFAGHIGYVRYWSVPKTIPEVLSTYNIALPNSTTGLIEQLVVDKNLQLSSIAPVTDTRSPVITQLKPYKLLLSQPKTPYGLKLDGVSGYADLGFGAGRNMATSPMSMELLVRIPVVPSGSIQVAGAPVGSNRRFYVGKSGSSSNWVAGITGDWKISDIPMVANKWTHVVLSTDGSIARMMVDGVFATFPNGVWSYGSYTLAGNLWLATLSDTSVFADIEIAYVRLWEGRPETSYLKSIVNKRLTPDTPNLIEQYIPAYNSIRANSSATTLYGGNSIIESTAPVGQRSSLRFHGVSQSRVNSTIDSSNIIGTNPYTLEAWVFPLAYTNDYNYILSLGNGTNQTGNMISMGFRGDGQIFQSGWDSPLINFNYQIPLNRWTHVAISNDGSISKLYVNGVYQEQLAAQFNCTGTKLNICANTLDLNHATALISCVRLWSIALNTEIGKRMHSYVNANAENLIEEFRLNESVGLFAYGTKSLVANISSSNTWQTATVANWVNKCAMFEGGLIKYMKIPVIPITDKGITIEGWWKVRVNNATGSSATRFLEFCNGRGIQRVILAFDSNGKIFAGGKTTPLTNVTIDIGVWMHLALTIDADTGVGVLYKNGISGYTGSIGLDRVERNYNVIAASVYRLENSQGNGDLWLDGQGDEIRVWNTARTSTEIAENYQRTLDRHPNLVGYWRMDGNGWDHSGHGNHLTPIGYGSTDPYVVSDNPNLVFNAPIND